MLGDLAVRQAEGARRLSSIDPGNNRLPIHGALIAPEESNPSYFKVSGEDGNATCSTIFFSDVAYL